MIAELTEAQRTAWRDFAAFADKEIGPRAADCDARQTFSPDIVRALAEAGYLAATVPVTWGGGGMDMVSYGLLSEEIGRSCQNVRNFLAVDDMVAHAIARWGSAAQREHWLPEIRSGRVLAAFALTEPGVGSDAGAVETTAEPVESDDGQQVFVVNGHKKWISFAQIADLFLVFVKIDGGHSALLVPRDTPGLTVRPIGDLLGLRGSMLGEIALADCRVPAGNLVGRIGMGLTFVASSSLDLGRYSTAWGSVGLAQACLDASARYAEQREQYGVPILDHQLVRRMLADMITDTAAARALCHQAGLRTAAGDPDAVNHTLMAKYRASTVAVRSAADTVQIHGAQGIGPETPAQRHYRDAKVMEIIEGTSEIQQSILGQYAAQSARRR